MRRSDTEKESTGIATPAISDTFQDWQYLGTQNRKIYFEIPPKVEYSLTERGHSLMKVLASYVPGEMITELTMNKNNG